MADYPGILTYHDVLVVPFDSLYGKKVHQGGPIWPDWDDPSPARFYRESGPADDRPAEVEAEAHIDAPNAFWIGPLYHHFGHMLLEILTRVAPSVAANPQAELVFAVFPGSLQSFAEAPGWLRDMLEWHGVSPDRIRVIDRPVRFSRLHVAPQPERAGFDDPPPPHPAYLDDLTSLAHRRLGTIRREGALFVSRSSFLNGLVGEAYLDEVFAQAGVSVIHPEEMTFVDQLRAYAEHETLIFSEGSALHGFQQLGRHGGEGVVLKRRPAVDAGHVVCPPRFRRFEFVEATRTRAVELKKGCIRNHAGGLSFLDVPVLFQGMRSFGIDLEPHWNQERFERVSSRQVLRWLSTSMVRGLAGCPSQAPRLAAALHEVGMPGALGWAMRAAHWSTKRLLR